MAVSSGVRPHRAFLTVRDKASGAERTFPVVTGSYDKKGTGEASSFSASIPSGLEGAFEFFASLGDNDAQIFQINAGAKESVFKGSVNATDFDVISGKIGVTGECKLASLIAEKTSEKFVNQKNDEVVKTLAARVGLNASITLPAAADAGRYVQIDWAQITDNVSLAAVIQKAAETEGARWWVDGDTLKMVPRDSDEGVYTITVMRSPRPDGQKIVGDALRLSIRRNVKAGKGVSVKTKSWNPRKKQAVVGEYTVGGAGGTTNYGYHVPGLTQSAADKHAKEKARQAARHELTVTAHCAGDATVNAAKKLRLIGCAPFEQDYAIDSIRGTFGMGGHKMTITARSAKKGRS